MKLAKQTLAVVLALVMAFSAFSVVGSAKFNSSTTTEAVNPATGTIKYGLDLYKVTSDGLDALSEGDALQPGDIVEVQLKFGTDFYLGLLSTQVYYDSTYFEPALDGEVYTDSPANTFLEANSFIKMIEEDAPVAETITGIPATLFDTITPAEKTGIAGYVNKAETGWKTWTPLAWREINPRTGKQAATMAILEEYAMYHYVGISFPCNAQSSTGGWEIQVPYAPYFSFQLRVKDGADSNGATTPIFVPMDGMKHETGETCNRLYATECPDGEYKTKGLVALGQALDLTDADFDLIIGEVAGPHEHSYTLTGHQDATCTEDGYDEYTCDCGDSYRTVIDALGHNYQVTATVDATCTEDGYKTFTCSRCGDSYNETIEATGHEWGAWTTVTEPTTEADGLEKRVCSKCGEEETRVLPKIAVITVEDDPTDVSITYPETVYGGEIELVVERLTSGASYDLVASKSASFVLYDIKTVLNGVEVQPNGNVTVKIPVPADMDAAKVKVYRVNGTALDSVNATYEDGFMVFTANHFSEYALSVEKTEADYTIEVYTMKTSAPYEDAEVTDNDYELTTTDSKSGTIGTTVYARSADYESTGLTVNTGKSTLSARLTADGATLKVYLDRATSLYTFKYPDVAANDGTFIELEQFAGRYGAQVSTPEPKAIDGWTFDHWYIEGTDTAYEGGEAGAGEFEVLSAYNRNIAPGEEATAEDLAALNAAIATLPDPVNLKYYTDAAIMDVCNTLGGGYANADAFIENAYNNGYSHKLVLKQEVLDATDRINNVLMATGRKMTAESLNYVTLNDDGLDYAPNRDESKANLKVSLVPEQVNGKDVTAADRKVTLMESGDQVTLAIYVETDYFVSGGWLPIVFDATKFNVVDADGYSYEYGDSTFVPELLLDQDGIDQALIHRRYGNYEDIECYGWDSKVQQYPAKYQTDEYASYRDANKILLIAVDIKTADTTVPQIFSGSKSFIGRFTLEAKEGIAYDGTLSTMVGIPADWFASDTNGRSNQFALTRAAGVNKDGSAAVNSAPMAVQNYDPYDKFAQFGQTYTSEMATITFGSTECQHEYGDPDWTWADDYTSATASFTCPKCGDVQTVTDEAPVEDVVTAATCTANKFVTYTATVEFEGESYTTTAGAEAPIEVENTKIPHTPGDAVRENEVAATCTAKGSYDSVVYCSVCGEEISRETIETDMIDHTPADAVIENEVAATCTAKGSYDSVVYCSVCGTELSRETIETDMLAHEWSAWTADAADETVGHSLTHSRTCAVGGETQTVDHDFDVEVDPATCTTEGKKTYTCSDCGYSYEETIPMTEHTLGDWEEIAGDDDIHGKYCDECGNLIETEAHDYGDAPTAHQDPGPDADGYNIWTCSVCGHQKTETLLYNHTHTPGEPVRENVVDATCTKEGSYDEVVYCTECGEELSRETKTIDMIPHTEADAVIENEVAATCTAKGSYDTVVYCSVCGTELSRETIETDMIDHTPADAVIENEVAATCTAKGSYDSVVYCSVCGEELSRETIETDMIPHTPADAVKENEVEATCSKEGSYDEVVYCSVCGEELSRETKTVDKIPHTPADAVKENEVAATCTKEGSYDEVVYCSVCGEELSRETKTVDKIPHTPADAVKENEVAATCTADGSYDSVVYCSVCGEELSRETVVVPATGHEYGDPVWTWSEDNSSATMTITCKEGDDTQTVTATVEETVVSEATATSDKVVTYTATATVDGTVYTDKKENVEIPGTKTELLISATGHDGTKTDAGKAIEITVPYARKGALALTLEASEDNVTYSIDAKGSKILSVDENGKVTFTRLCVFCRTATITVKDAAGKEATCKVTVKLKWWQILIWFLFGCLWY